MEAVTTLLRVSPLLLVEHKTTRHVVPRGPREFKVRACCRCFHDGDYDKRRLENPASPVRGLSIWAAAGPVSCRLIHPCPEMGRGARGRALSTTGCSDDAHSATGMQAVGISWSGLRRGNDQRRWNTVRSPALRSSPAATRIDACSAHILGRAARTSVGPTRASRTAGACYRGSVRAVRRLTAKASAASPVRDFTALRRGRTMTRAQAGDGVTFD